MHWQDILTFSSSLLSRLQTFGRRICRGQETNLIMRYWELPGELGIEFIHAKGLKTFFSDHKAPKLTKIHHRIDQLKIELKLNTQHFLSEAVSTLEPPKKYWFHCKTEWFENLFLSTKGENWFIEDGYNAALDLEFPFALLEIILSWSFRDGQYCRKLRIPEDLRCLYIRLKKRLQIDLDEPSGYLYLTGSNIDECTLDIDKIRAYMVANPAQNKIMDAIQSHYESLPLLLIMMQRNWN